MNSQFQCNLDDALSLVATNEIFLADHKSREARLYHLLKPTDTEITPYAYSNKHGLWKGETRKLVKGQWTAPHDDEL